MTQRQIVEAFNTRSYLGGMGDLGITTQQITGTAGGAIMAAAGPIALINPLAGAIVAGVGALTSLIGSLFQPDIKKEQATAIVNQLEAEHLKPALAMWQSLRPDQKTVSAQAAYLAQFDAVWNAVLQGCGNPQLGSAGQACISDRQAGSCHWTQTGQTPGVPPNCGNWFIWYRQPVANDPNVIPDPVSTSTAGVVGTDLSSALTGGGSLSPLAIGMGLILVALFIGD